MQDESHEGQEKSDLKVYEAGYLIVPSVAEEKLPEIVSSLKAVIEEAGGLFISEDFPKLIPLAYEMVLSEDNKKQKFNQGYFGWMKFEIASDVINTIAETFRKNENILRHLVLETVKENTLYSHKLLAKKTKERVARKSSEDSEGEQASSEEIDKSIDDLVAEEEKGEEEKE